VLGQRTTIVIAPNRPQIIIAMMISRPIVVSLEVMPSDRPTVEKAETTQRGGLQR
jgi:hypothetical protein